MEKKPTRHYSKLQEEKVADYLNGVLTPNSGSKHKKGDILLKDTIVECKTRTKQSISHTIKKEWILDLKKECIEMGKKYFSVASGGGTGRTLHPDNMAAGPASYGMTDTMGRMHSDAQFAGSSSVPAHVEMMGLIGMGNNPMVGATVAVAVAVEEAQK